MEEQHEVAEQWGGTEAVVDEHEAVVERRGVVEEGERGNIGSRPLGMVMKNEEVFLGTLYYCV